MIEVVDYNSIRDLMLTGDQLLFDGKGLVSFLIKIATKRRSRNCPYKLNISHCAKVYVIGGNVFSWESAEFGETKGVQMNLISQRLQTYKGDIYYRPLIYDRDSRFYEAYRNKREEWKDVKYERNLLELLGTILFWKNTEDFSSIFCSELTGGIDKESGPMDETHEPANGFVPNDWLPNCKVDNILRMRTGKRAHYGKIVKLVLKGENTNAIAA